MPQQIQLRRGTAAQAASINPILAEGELGVELDTGKFKLGNGVTAWNSLPYSSGVQGFQGAQGPQGFQGTTGFQGTQGQQGVQGNQGFQGLTGSGAQGSQGSTGAQGSQGFQGATGSGTQGAQGTAGAQGPQGFQGATNIWGRVTANFVYDTTVDNITETAVDLVANGVYEFSAYIGNQSSSTAGAQFGIQCSVAGAGVQGWFEGSQAALGANALRVSERITTQGFQSTAVTRVTGDGVCTMGGIVVAPASACQLFLTARKITSGSGNVRIGSFLKVTRIS